MSTRREREPIIPDRLPGERELSRLYQQTPDEHPPAALDAAILAEARRATRPRLRLLKGGKSLGQLSRRWAIPISLAAALLITIGVVSFLQDEMDDVERPLMRSQTIGARLSEAEAPYPQRDEQDEKDEKDEKDERVQQEEQKNRSKLALPRDAAQLEDGVAQPDNEAMRPAVRGQSAQAAQSSQPIPVKPSASASEYRQENVPMPAAPAPMAKQDLQKGKKPTKAKRGLSSELRSSGAKAKINNPLRRKRPILVLLGMATEEAETSLMDALEVQRADFPMEPEKHSPQEWLEQISELFRLEKRQEAEDSLQAFQKQYPDYTDYPDSFPEDVLERLRKR